MLQPLTIGSLELPCNIIQGPLAGISCAPFRVVAHKYGNPAYCCSEMISAKHLVYAKNNKPRFYYKDPQEGLLCSQLAGSEPDDICRAAEILQTHGTDLIDLNCGCPMPKIRKKGTGSGLLKNAKQLASIIQAAKASISCPFTVKIRVDGLSQDNNNQAVLDAVNAAEPDALIIHARHWQDDYETPCHLEQLAWFADNCSVPIIANGDIKNLEDLQNLQQQTHCAGFMISRSGVGQPWLFATLQGHQEPSLAQKKSILLEHMDLLQQLEGDFLALLQMRRQIKYYLRHMASDEQLRYDFFKQETIAQAKTWIENL